MFQAPVPLLRSLTSRGELAHLILPLSRLLLPRVAAAPPRCWPPTLPQRPTAAARAAGAPEPRRVPGLAAAYIPRQGPLLRQRRLGGSHQSQVVRFDPAHRLLLVVLVVTLVAGPTGASPCCLRAACRWVVPLLWLPLAAALAVRAAATLPLHTLAALAAAGVVLWQLIEYSMHRWVFHAAPGGPNTIVAHFLMHGWVLMHGSLSSPNFAAARIRSCAAAVLACLARAPSLLQFLSAGIITSTLPTSSGSCSRRCPPACLPPPSTARYKPACRRYGSTPAGDWRLLCGSPWQLV